jgi:hypothetical protein
MRVHCPDCHVVFHDARQWQQHQQLHMSSAEGPGKSGCVTQFYAFAAAAQAAIATVPAAVTTLFPALASLFAGLVTSPSTGESGEMPPLNHLDDHLMPIKNTAAATHGTPHKKKTTGDGTIASDGVVCSVCQRWFPSMHSMHGHTRTHKLASLARVETPPPEQLQQQRSHTPSTTDDAGQPTTPQNAEGEWNGTPRGRPKRASQKPAYLAEALSVAASAEKTGRAGPSPTLSSSSSNNNHHLGLGVSPSPSPRKRKMAGSTLGKPGFVPIEASEFNTPGFSLVFQVSDVDAFAYPPSCLLPPPPGHQNKRMTPSPSALDALAFVSSSFMAAEERERFVGVEFSL